MDKQIPIIHNLGCSWLERHTYNHLETNPNFNDYPETVNKKILLATDPFDVFCRT